MDPTTDDPVSSTRNGERGELNEATTDLLTGLPNRIVCIRLVKEALGRIRSVAILVLDVDDFRAINNRYLHIAGDEVLRQLGGLLLSAIRPGDRVGRFGGDRFLVVAPDTARPQADALGKRIRAAVAEVSFQVSHSPDLIRLTVGIGIAVAEVGQPGDAEQLIRLAENELDEAKARRRELSLGVLEG